LIQGDAADKRELRRAGVARANRVLAVSDDDSANVGVIMRTMEVTRSELARNVAGPNAFIHIVDPQLRVALRRHRAFRADCGIKHVSILWKAGLATGFVGRVVFVLDATYRINTATTRTEE
jgi:hypothetical protein